MHLLLPSLAVVSALLPAVNAWGAAGHEIVATIAQIYLHPTVLPKMCDILNFHSSNPNEPICHLAPIASWADKNRWHMRWSSSLHYVGANGDYPSQTCLFPGPRGWAGREGINVLNGIRNTTTILEDYVKDEVSIHTANEAFKFLVHFIGDVHQPLHLTGRARGGNGIKVLFDGRQTKLHTLWDSGLIAKSLRTIPHNYTRPLPSPEVEYNLRGAIYDPYIRRIIWEGISGKWKDELTEWLSCPSSLNNPTTSSVTLSIFQRVAMFLVDLVSPSTSPADETDDDILCPYAWAQPIHQFNCDFIWPAALDEPPYSQTSYDSSSEYVDNGHNLTPQDEASMFDGGAFIGLNDTAARGGPYLELDTPEYAGKISKEWVVEKLLAQGGIRLAATLNWLFADLGDDQPTMNVFLAQRSVL